MLITVRSGEATGDWGTDQARASMVTSVSSYLKCTESVNISRIRPVLFKLEEPYFQHQGLFFVLLLFFDSAAH